MLIRLIRVIDQIVLTLGALLVIYYRPGVDGISAREGVPVPSGVLESLVVLILVFGWIVIFDYSVRYKANRLVALRIQIKSLFKATTLASFWFLIVCALFSIESVGTFGVLFFWVLTTTVGVMTRLTQRWILINARKSGYNYRYIIVVGVNKRSRELAERLLEKPELGYKLVGFVNESELCNTSCHNNEICTPVIGNISALRQILARERVDEILVCLSVEAKFRSVMEVIQHARDLGVVLRVVPDISEGAIFQRAHVEEFDEQFVLTFFREQMLLQLFVKRLLDVLISATILILLFPVILLVAILIKVASPGPVFYTQDRVGMNQRRFKMYKFRSMIVGADLQKKKLQHLNEVDGPVFKIEKDPRVTRIGGVLRKTSIDEIPQLFNVLRGEMSLVGPRPPLPDEVVRYHWLFRRRLSVKPGITCVWQVSGRNQVPFDEWMNMDRQYVDNWSLWLDFKILIKTIPAVFFCRGSY
jgi:exopolysaccharide biosynthesis polyprenyl glycosylphosphotransferase